MEKILLNGTRFINESGREVILHGMNVLCRDAALGHFYPDFENAFPFFQRMGFNLLRFGIFWHGVEPRPGVYDETYLGRVKEIVNLAESCGIYLILDMHQDLFAQKYIDGAPDWACLDDGLPHPESCTIWYNAYLESDAIIRAADNFWANKPAEDGATFRQMRICHMHKGKGKIRFGIYACSPEESSFQAVFSKMQLMECQWEAHDGQQPDGNE